MFVFKEVFKEGKVLKVPTHVHKIRIYTEDTDLSGIVYHANYLKFADIARTEMVRLFKEDAFDQKGPNYLFAVTSASLNFFHPARMDNLLNVETIVVSVGRVSLELMQNIFNNANNQNLCEIKIKLCFVAKNMINGTEEIKPTKIPDILLEKLGEVSASQLNIV